MVKMGVLQGVFLRLPLYGRRTRTRIAALCLALVSASFLVTFHLGTIRALVPAPAHSAVWLEEVRAGEGEGGQGWFWSEGEPTCTPTTNIAFLKSHKCASSAIQNILFRYAHNEGLILALPDYGNYYGGGTSLFRAPMYLASPWAKLGANIFAIHTKWNHKEIVKIMPNDTVYLSIVREPTQLFESLYTYTKMDEHYKMDAEQFVLRMPVSSPRHHGYLGYNQMAWDFGMPASTINNITAVAAMVERSRREFDFVMVAERMEESLVLLAHFLCWHLRDVIVLKLNARENKYKTSLSEAAVTVLREKLAPDYLIYNYFLDRFDALVEDFGRRRMAREVQRLRRLTRELVRECGFDRKPSQNMTGINKPWSNMVEGYTTNATSGNCTLYSISEHAFINKLRDRQRQQVMKRFGLREPSAGALPSGAVALGGPGGMTPEEAVKVLKKTLVHANKSPQGKPGVPPQESGVPPQKSGVPPQKPGIPLQKSGIPPQKSGIPPQKSGVQPKKSGVPPQKSGVPPQKSGIPPRKSRVPVPQQKSGVPPQKSGVPPQKLGVQQRKPGVPPRKSGVETREAGRS